jgi:hypothetical protein
MIVKEWNGTVSWRYGDVRIKRQANRSPACLETPAKLFLTAVQHTVCMKHIATTYIIPSQPALIHAAQSHLACSQPILMSLAPCPRPPALNKQNSASALARE